MGTVSDIKTGIASLVVSGLGADYTELQYGIDVAKNRFQGCTKGYAINPGKVDQTEGVTRHITVGQEFEIVLTETFGQSQTGDQLQRSTASTLYDRLETLYRAIVREKAATTGVIQVGTLAVDTPEFLDSNVAVLRATVVIKYRTAL